MKRAALPSAMPYVEYDEVQAVCSDCGRIFPSDDALAAHRTEAHGGLEGPGTSGPAKLIDCSVCHKKFRSTAALTDHNRKAHTS
jgi:uncharacterized C2H2 Zn-finger protein